jgi:hypothetical protein
MHLILQFKVLKKHKQFVFIAQLVKALQLAKCILVLNVLSSNPGQVKKLSLKNLTVGTESQQQVDSEKIITTRYLEEIHSCKIGRK